MSTEIRELEIEELHVIEPLCRMMHAEIMEKQFKDWKLPYRFDLLEDQLSRLMSMRMANVWCMFVSSIPAGFLQSMDLADPCIGGFVTAESLWYVKPDYRSLGLVLLRPMLDHAQDIGSQFATLGHFPKVAGNHMGKLYEKLGFLHFQEQYIKLLSPKG